MPRSRVYSSITPAAMKLLVVCDGARHEVLAAGSWTAREVKAKVPGGSEDGVLAWGPVILADDTPIAEQGVAERERLVLTTSASATGLGAAIGALAAAAAELGALESQIVAGAEPHQEYFTRVLERLDGLVFDACARRPRPRAGPARNPPHAAHHAVPRTRRLSEAERNECRRRRKGLVHRAESVSAGLR